MLQVRQQGAVRIAPLTQFRNTRSELPPIGPRPGSSRIRLAHIAAQAAFAAILLLVFVVIASL